MSTAAQRFVSGAVNQDADRQLKAKHRALWASGDYPALAAELIPALGPELVRACGVRAGDRVLDVAAGSGNAAIPAAVAGAIVTASDLTPELFDAGHRIAAERGVDLEWVEADAEALPFADDSFDVVMSCVGVMFAPHHQDGRRRTGPGVPAGWNHRDDQLDTGRVHRQPVRDHEAVRAATAAPAPARRRCGATNPTSENCWATESLGCGRGARRFAWTTARTRQCSANTGGATTGRPSRSTGSTRIGPERIEDLDRDFLNFLTMWNQAAEDGRTSYDAEYLLVTTMKQEQQ